MLNWLMQRTADGATYLQVAIIITLIVAFVFIGIDTGRNMYYRSHKD